MSEQPWWKLNLVSQPEPNFELQFGDTKLDLMVCFGVRKTRGNRLKWWLFCKVFPCRVARWDDVR